MNRVVLCGTLAGRPKLRYTPGGVAVVALALLVLRDDPGSRQRQETDEIECLAFREAAERLASWGEAGHRLNLEGRLRFLTDPDSSAPSTRRLRVVADWVYFVNPVLPPPSPHSTILPVPQAASSHPARQPA